MVAVCATADCATIGMMVSVRMTPAWAATGLDHSICATPDCASAGLMVAVCATADCATIGLTACVGATPDWATSGCAVFAAATPDCAASVWAGSAIAVCAMAQARTIAPKKRRIQLLHGEVTAEFPRQNLSRTYSRITTPLSRIAIRSSSGLPDSGPHDDFRKITALRQTVSASTMHIFPGWQAAPYTSANYRKN